MIRFVQAYIHEKLSSRPARTTLLESQPASRAHMHNVALPPPESRALSLPLLPHPLPTL